MQSYKTKIFEIALRLLVERQVDAVLGFRRGTIPMLNQPVLIRHPEGTDQLHWDSFCSTNLANYLPQRKERIAIFAKGCDSRNIVLQIQENQIKREQLYIIGVPCQGMVDRRRLLAKLAGRKVLEVRENAQQLSIRGEGFEETVQRDKYLQENCAICSHRNPVIYDEMVAEATTEQSPRFTVKKIRKPRCA
jgi:coenzyme F420-reducing hydrogenase beta subunit